MKNITDTIQGGGRKTYSFLLTATIALCAASANAATWYWTGNGGDLNWFTPANWNTAVDGSGAAATELVSGDNFTFGSAIDSATAINYNPSGDDFSIDTITFASGCGAVTVSGSPIASVGKMVNETSTIQTFQNAVQFSSTVNMTGPSAWNDAYITFSGEGGATGTYPENYRYFRGKQTFTRWV